MTTIAQLVLALVLGSIIAAALMSFIYFDYADRLVDWVYHAVTGRRTRHWILLHFNEYYGDGQG